MACAQYIAGCPASSCPTSLSGSAVAERVGRLPREGGSVSRRVCSSPYIPIPEVGRHGRPRELELVTLTHFDWNRLEQWLWTLKSLRDAIEIPIPRSAKAPNTQRLDSDCSHP